MVITKASSIMRDIRREHIVPMNVLEGKLFPLIEQGNLLEAEQILIQFGDMALITREEDEKLNQLGLRDTMPDPNDQNSRYSRAGINLIGKVSTLFPNSKINRGGRGRLCCRDIQKMNRIELIRAIRYHLKHKVTGRPVAGELLRSWQLGQDYFISEEAGRFLMVQHQKGSLRVR